mgnify:CR=1 FL=1
MTMYLSTDIIDMKMDYLFILTKLQKHSEDITVAMMYMVAAHSHLTLRTKKGHVVEV